MKKIELSLAKSIRMISPGFLAVITSFHKGQTDITPVSWNMPVSNEPPMVAFAVTPTSLCFDLVKRSGEFVVNVPTLDIVNQITYCGTVSGRDVDKFKQTGLVPLEPRMVRAPLIEQCIGHLECGVVESYQPGNYTVFVGQVVYAWVAEDAFEDGWKMEEPELRPINHIGSMRYGAIENVVQGEA